MGVVALVVPLAACGDDAPESDRAGQIYAAIVRALVPVAEDDDEVHRDVYIAATEEATTIPIGVQADAVAALDEYSNVRFVDSADEAVATEDDGAPVRNDGVLLVVDEVPERGDRVRVSVERYVTADDTQSFRLLVEPVGARWEVLEPPPPLPSDDD